MNPLNPIERSVLTTIRTKHIAPTPRWYFALIHKLSWAGFVLLLLAGSTAVGVVVLLLLDRGTDIATNSEIDRAMGPLSSIPIAWGFVTLLLLFLSYRLFMSTKNGYRHQIVARSTLAISLIIGIGFYSTEGAEHLEQKIAQIVPHYSDAVTSKTTIWSQANKGLIAGTVTEVYAPDDFEIQGLDNKNYRISGSQFTEGSMTPIVPGMEVRLVGRINTEPMATEARPMPTLMQASSENGTENGARIYKADNRVSESTPHEEGSEIEETERNSGETPSPSTPTMMPQRSSIKRINDRRDNSGSTGSSTEQRRSTTQQYNIEERDNSNESEEQNPKKKTSPKVKEEKKKEVIRFNAVTIKPWKEH